MDARHLATVAAQAPQVATQAPQVAEQAPQAATQAPQAAELAPQVAVTAPQAATQAQRAAVQVPQIADPIAAVPAAVAVPATAVVPTTATVPASAAIPATAAVPATAADPAIPANQYNFKRYELKYLITPEQRVALDALIAENLVPDEHGRSLVSSIYYDTPSNLLMRRSIEGGVYKEKLRVRGYGRVDAGSQVFVEIKKKCEGVVYKRRVSATPAQADFAIAAGHGLGNDQISREIEGFVSRYPGIEAAMLVSYERCAYHTPSADGTVLGGGDGTGELRLTLDENIRWIDREDGRVWFDRAGEGRDLIPAGYALMEAKCAGALPLWFVEFLSANEIRSQSFSKCGNAYRTRQAMHAAEALATAQAPAVLRNPQRVSAPNQLPTRQAIPTLSKLAPGAIRPRSLKVPRAFAQKGSVAYV